MRVAIITWTCWENIGTHLQAYAIQNVLSRYEKKVKIINYDFLHNGKREKLKDLLLRILAWGIVFIPHKIIQRYHIQFYNFRHRFFCYTKRVNDTSIKSLNSKFDVFVCGSDQIWNPEHFNDKFMLSFVEDKKKKISYAPSIGLSYIPQTYQDIYKKWISRLDFVSIRENTGAALLHDIGISSQVVLDPTFLLTKGEWAAIEDKNKKIEQPYVLCYFLNYTDRYFAQIQNLANLLKCKIVILSKSFPKDCKEAIWFAETSPTYFLALIHNSKHVITDSYHGAIFSIIFEKEFHLYQRFRTNDPHSENSRIEQIIDMCRLQDCLVTDSNAILSNVSIDYLKVSLLLKQWQKKSFDFLQNALYSDGTLKSSEESL